MPKVKIFEYSYYAGRMQELGPGAMPAMLSPSRITLSPR